MSTIHVCEECNEQVDVVEGEVMFCEAHPKAVIVNVCECGFMVSDHSEHPDSEYPGPYDADFGRNS